MDLAKEIISTFDLALESRKILQECSDIAVIARLNDFDSITVKSFSLDEELEKLQHQERLLPIDTDIRQLRRQVEVELKEVNTLMEAINESKATKTPTETLLRKKEELQVKNGKMKTNLEAANMDHGLDLQEIIQKVKIFENKRP